MQHSTNNHTPTPQPPPPTHNPRALDNQIRSDHPKEHQPVSPQDPTVCQTLQRLNMTFAVFHPATPTTNNPKTQEAGAVNRDEPFSERRQAPHNTWELLRKEVIQPHLPVRLPCYDFVLIASPTFDNSLPYGLGRRLRVLPTFMT